MEFNFKAIAHEGKFYLQYQTDHIILGLRTHRFTDMNRDLLLFDSEADAMEFATLRQEINNII